MKRTTIFKTLALAAATLAIGVAFGQDGPPPDGRPPGPPMGGPRGMNRPPMGPAGLLMNPKVQSELKLSPDQIDKIMKLGPSLRQGRGRWGGPQMDGPEGGPRQAVPGPGGPGQDGAPQNGPERDEPDRQGPRDRPEGGPGMGGPRMGGPGGREMDKKIKSVLSESQYRRFSEIRLQVEGLRSVTRPEVAERLGLSQEQIKKIRDLMPRGPMGGPGGRQGRGGGGGEFGRPDGAPEDGPQDRPIDGTPQEGQGGRPPQDGPMDGRDGGPGRGGPGGFGGARMHQMDQKILAILTDEQKQKWSAMQGKKFDLGMRRPS